MRLSGSDRRGRLGAVRAAAGPGVVADGGAALGLIFVGLYLLGVLLFGLAIVDRAPIQARDHDERLREDSRTR